MASGHSTVSNLSCECVRAIAFTNTPCDRTCITNKINRHFFEAQYQFSKDNFLKIEAKIQFYLDTHLQMNLQRLKLTAQDFPQYLTWG